MAGYFRFQRYREDADDGEWVVAYKRAVSEPWACEVCGTWDGQRDERCVYCSHRRGCWPCDCGHVNNEGSDDCEHCGEAKESE